MLLPRPVKKWCFVLGIFVCGITGLWLTIAFIFNPVDKHVSVARISSVLTPDLENLRGKQLLVVILVTSPPSNVRARMAIRETWGYEHWNTSKVSRFHVVFMLGTSNNRATESQIQEEALIYGDLLIGNFEDSYGNLPLKSLLSLRWSLGVRSRYILKTDDDMYINTARLVNWLEGFKLPRLYGGRVRYKARVMRFRFHRYSVAYSNFQETLYPPYCYGGFYVLSHNALTALLDVSNMYRPFPAEDAYLGVLAQEIGLKPTDLSDKIFLMKSNYWKQIDVNCLDDDVFLNAIAIGDNLKPRSLQYVHNKVAVQVKKSFRREDRKPCEIPTGWGYAVFLVFGLITVILIVIRFCKLPFRVTRWRKLN